MNKGVDFLSPNTISCIIVLNEYSNLSNKLDTSTPFANFFINKIMVNNIFFFKIKKFKNKIKKKEIKLR